MKFILTYPPDYDGELHFNITKEKTGPITALRVSFVVSQQAGETEVQTMQRVGADLARQPWRLLLSVGEL